MSEHHSKEPCDRVRVRNEKDRKRMDKLKKKVLEQAQKLLDKRNRAKAYQICRDINADVDQSDARKVGRWLGNSPIFEKKSSTNWGLVHE